jgi:hypothetical protein
VSVIGTHDGASAKFSTNSHETDYSVERIVILHTLQDEYVYETGGGTGEMRRNGARIVGAAKADHGSIPFIVAWTSEVDEKRVDSECTG